MKKLISITVATVMCAVLMLSTFGVSAKAQIKPLKKGDTVAVMKTNYGDIGIRFYDKVAPKGVENFITLAKDGKYDDTIFHRVVDNFMIQGGDYTNFDGTGGGSCWGEDFDLECDDDVSNSRGTISYANRGPGTNGSQFFINSVDNAYLDGNYTVFGEVFSGMDVVDLISDCKVTANTSGENSQPVNKVEIKTVEVTEYSKGMEKDFAQPVDPYEGMDDTQDATEVSTSEVPAETTQNSSLDSVMPLLIIVIVILAVIAGIVVFVVIAEAKNKKKREAQKAKKYPHKKKK